jgi:hypothetical protein
MSSPSTGRRRSSLSAAFDHFRDRCRKTRIDSLLSPPKLDSGTSNDEGGDLSSSSLEGVPLTSGSSDQSLGINVDMKVKEEEDAGKDEVKEDDKQSHRDSKLPQLIFDDDGFGDLELAAEQSSFTSLDEDKRLLSALADFSTEVTEAEDFGRYFSLPRQRNTGKQPLQEESISPGESFSIGVGSNSVSGSFTRLLHSDASGSTLNFEVGVPLHRTVANGNLRREWTTQVQTEPQTQEQSEVRSTYASPDQLVQDTVSMEDNEEEEDSEREEDVPVMRTVDGVRLDARPLIRHSGTSAPAHSSLQLHEMATSTSKATTERKPSLPRPRLISCFPSTNESSGDDGSDLPPRRHRRSTIKPNQPPPSTISTKSHQTTIEHNHHIPSYNPLLTTAAHGSLSDQEPFYYSHTPPRLTFLSKNALSISKTQQFSTLSSRSEVAMFHGSVIQKLHTTINTGEIKPCQIGVRERVRRLSGAGARRVGEWEREIGEAVIASGGVGVGWGDQGIEGEVGRRGAGVCLK